MRKNKYFVNSENPLDIITYEGSGQCVHPDVIRIDYKFYDFKYLMVMEPYPYGIDSYENPSIICSNDSINWVVPDKIKNPIVDPPINGGWNSDADILNFHNERLLLYYRFNSGLGETSLLCKKSVDGLRWSKPEKIFRIDISGKFASPALVEIDGDIYMFYVDTIEQDIYIMKSNDGIQWKENRKLLRFANAWHLDALVSDRTFYVLLNDKYSLILLRSNDLETWFIYNKNPCKHSFDEWRIISDEIPSFPILCPSNNGWDNKIIYRSSFLIDGSLLKLWYSAQSKNNIWKIGYTDGFIKK